MKKLLFLVILSITTLFSQQQARVKIASVEVIGVKTASEDVVKINSGLRVGEYANTEIIADAIRQLWNMKIFSDIRILMDRETAEGVYFIISVEEYPRLDKVVLKGNKKIKVEDIEEELGLLTGQVLSPHVVYEAQRLIKELYFKEGYLLAEVVPATFEGEKENSRGITFTITENEKVKIYQISFKGNTEVSARKLKKAMENVKEERWWKIWVENEYNDENLEKDMRSIENLYRSLGYRDAEVVYDTISYGEDNKKMYLDIEINEGPQYHYSDITVSGNTLFDNKMILSGLGIEKGDVYNSEELMMNIEQYVRGAYMDKGYLYCQVNPIEVPVSADSVSIAVEIVEMNPVKIRRINIVGNDKTWDNIIRRELRVYPGDLFNRTALMRSQRDVYILNYFANVIPDVVPVSQEEIDLEFTVEEKHTGTATASAGYSERDGFIGTVGVQFPNLRGSGQQLSFSFQRAGGYQSSSISYVEPWLMNTPNLVGFSVFDSDRSRNDTFNPFGSTTSYTPYDIHTRGGSVTFGRRFKFPDNYFRGRWAFQAMTNDYDTTKVYDWATFNRINPAHIEHTSGISLTQTITRDSRNAPEFPTGGSVLSLVSKYSGFGGNETFFKQNVSLDWYTPLWKDKLALKSYFESGYLKSLKEGDKYIIPYDEYLFMGGAGLIWGSALRGYPERSIGGYFGGVASMKYSLEARFQLSPNPMMYLLAFAEAGNVWDDLNKIDINNLKRSAGFGARIIMPPLGLIGVDFGWGFDREKLGLEPNGLTSPEIHFIFGQQF